MALILQKTLARKLNTLASSLDAVWNPENTLDGRAKMWQISIKAKVIDSDAWMNWTKYMRTACFQYLDHEV